MDKLSAGKFLWEQRVADHVVSGGIFMHFNNCVEDKLFPFSFVVVVSVYCRTECGYGGTDEDD